MEKVKKRSEFVVTNMFNGVMELSQGPNNTARENGYVSSQTETVHNIIISEKDMKLYNRASYIRVYWFIDCLYVGMTDTLNFSNWYRTENGKYNIEAVLMLSFEPMPQPTSTTQAPTTTTTTTTSTTTTPT
jgi:membrane carboxypeptidase/penicillin-binding protein PbpC